MGSPVLEVVGAERVEELDKMWEIEDRDVLGLIKLPENTSLMVIVHLALDGF